MSYSVSGVKPWFSNEVKRDALEGAFIGVVEGHLLSALFAAAHLDSGVTQNKLDRVVNVSVIAIVVSTVICVSLSVMSGIRGRLK